MAQSQLKNLFFNKRNPIAKILKFFTPKRIPNKKKYDRKKVSQSLRRNREW